MINEPVEGGLGEGAADLLARMGGAFAGEEGGEEGGGMLQSVAARRCASGENR
jgi:hypothetical protein